MNRQQLAARIWRSANQMRSKIEASEYKDYILGFIFYKFLSQREVDFLRGEDWEDEDILTLDEQRPEDVRYLQDNVGYFIAHKDLFSTWLAKGASFDVSDVRDALSAFSRNISPNFRSVYDGVFDTLDTGLSKLGDNAARQTKAISQLLALIDPIPMDGHEDYDVLGFIYEYLIGQFAANAGKKAGEFYTPHEVAILMSEIVANHMRGADEIDIYDPTSGSASLLLTIGQSVAARMGNPEGIHYYAQELKANTYNLTRMNLVMRGISPSNISTKNADTLADDWPLESDSDKPLLVDACVSNPPYSQQWDQPTGADARFDAYGIAPKKKADYAFLLHNLYHLRRDGIMCIVLPHGVLFRGDAEGQIRRRLLEGGNIDAVIGLPANIFYGTGIPTIVMVVKKIRDGRDVLFVDASRGFVKDGKQNRLRARDIRRVVDAYEARRDVEGFAHVASFEEIERNDYNLNIPRYVDSSPTEPAHNLYATMFGGVPSAEIDSLGDYWQALPGLRAALFEEHDGYGQVRTGDVKATTREHESVKAWRTQFEAAFDGLGPALAHDLLDDVMSADATALLERETADVFARCASVPLVDAYEAYQKLCDAWQDVSADLEAIKTDGMNAIRAVDENMVLKKDKGDDSKEVEVQDTKVPWAGRVIPFELVQRTRLADELAEEEDTEARLSALDAELEGLLADMDEEDKSGDFCDEAGEKWVMGAVPEAILDEYAALSPEIDALAGYVRLLDEKAGVEAFVAYERAHPVASWADVPTKRDGTHTKANVNKSIRALEEDLEVDPDSLLARLLRAQEADGERSALKKKLKELDRELTERTKETIEGLTDEEGLELLRKKWVDSLVGELAGMQDEVLDGLAKKVDALAKRYETTMADVDARIAEESAALVGMLRELTGPESDMAGIAELVKLLGGE